MSSPTRTTSTTTLIQSAMSLTSALRPLVISLFEGPPTTGAPMSNDSNYNADDEGGEAADLPNPMPLVPVVLWSCRSVFAKIRP